MIHKSFHCPSCRQLGFLDTGDRGMPDTLVDAVCHYCGHVVTADEAAVEEKRARPSNLRGRAPRR